MGNLTRRIAEQWFPELSRLPDVSARNETLTTILHSYRVSRVVVFMFTPVLPFLITLPLRNVSREAWTFWLVGLLFFGSFILAIMCCDLMVMMVHRGSIQRRLRGLLCEQGRPTCLTCGYDLKGTREPRCPECATMIPIMAAVALRRPSLIQQVLQLGGRPDERLATDLTPLHYAAAVADRELMAALTPAGTNLETKDGKGHTPLHVAAMENNVEAARALIDAGAHVDALTDEGKSPLHLARESGHSEAALLLEKHGGHE